MLKKIRQYLLTEKFKSRLTQILFLLYSEKVYAAEEIVSTFNTSNSFEKLQYYIGIQIACKLKSPYSSSDINHFAIKYEESYKLASSSKEFEKRILTLNKDLAQAIIAVFNSEMNFQKTLRNDNKYSRQGIILSMAYAKGRPLNLKELEEANDHYLNIKKADDRIIEVQKEVKEFLKQL